MEEGAEEDAEEEDAEEEEEAVRAVTVRFFFSVTTKARLTGPMASKARNNCASVQVKGRLRTNTVVADESETSHRMESEHNANKKNRENPE